jgi:PAS domain S-box-containing protein
MSRLFKALDNSADGAFIIDEDLRIIYCNKVAEAILGFDNKDIVGQFCYHLLQGYDDGRHLICKEQCRVAKMSLNSKPVPNYDIHITTNYGVKRWMNMSIFTYNMADTNNKKVIVHLFHDLNNKKVNDKLLTDIVRAFNHTREFPPKNGKETNPLLGTLTPREDEILALLVDGHGTQDIADLLSISLNTARNHIQRILQKFQVHTRLEAVAIAIKHDFVS